jgi:hypothetical protein
MAALTRVGSSVAMRLLATPVSRRRRWPVGAAPAAAIAAARREPLAPAGSSVSYPGGRLA